MSDTDEKFEAREGICVEREKTAFFAAYHAQWLREEQRWIFDPSLKPGDPEHCWQAWRREVALGEP